MEEEKQEEQKQEEEEEQQQQQEPEQEQEEQEEDWTGWGTSTAGDCESHRATEECNSSWFRCHLIHTKTAQTGDSSLLSADRNLPPART